MCDFIRWEIGVKWLFDYEWVFELVEYFRWKIVLNFNVVLYDRLDIYGVRVYLFGKVLFILEFLFFS